MSRTGRGVVVGLLLIAAGAILWLVVGPGWRPMHGYYGWMMYGAGRPWFGGSLAVLYFIFCWALVIFGAWLLIRVLVNGPRAGERVAVGGPGGATMETPLDALKLRYARGEITREQYEEMRRDISEG